MSDEPRIPTLEDMQAIAEAAARAAVEASEVERVRAGQAGAAREADDRGVELPDGFLDQLGGMLRNPDLLNAFGEASASATIAQLEARGAFAEETANEEDSRTPETPEVKEDPSGGAEQTPRKTFAERFLGL